jgi:replicative DNA helicase
MSDLVEQVINDEGEEIEVDPDYTIEEDLIDHLAVPESVMLLWRERFDPELIDPRAFPELRDILTTVFAYIDETGRPPSAFELHQDIGYEFSKPKSHIRWLIRKFRERYKANKVKEILLASARSAVSDPDTAAETAVSNLTSLQAITSPRHFGLTNRDWTDQFRQYQQDVMDKRYAGYSFGWDEIDEYLGGLKKNNLVYVIGRPKRFKSWMLLKSAVETQFHPERPGKALLYSLEMSEDEMYQRYQSMVAGVNYGHFVNGTLTGEEQRKVEQAADKIEAESSIVIAHPPRGQRTVQALSQHAREIGADVVYIDQLKFVESTRKVAADKRHIEIEYINEDLKEATEDFPIYVACQFNREAASMTEMADLSKIGLSDSIGQTADMLLGLYQNKDMQANHLVEFGVIEARKYGVHRWDLAVDFATSNFNVDSKKVDY